MRGLVSCRDALDCKIATAFQNSLPVQTQTEPTLAAAVAHALKNSGSMVRARIAYQLARNFQLSELTALSVGLSIELFHTASLLFDDLPCMDNAQERRGAPCTHTKFGEAAALLAALALINKAYGLIWQAMAEVPAEVRVEASNYVEQCLGVGGILNGQSYDLHFNGQSAARVMRIAVGKTVSLIRLTLVLPALLGGASRSERLLLSKLSVFWGLAYQMMDDLKDVLAATTEAGKTTRRDSALGRPNLALAEGPIRTSRLLARLICLGDLALERGSEHTQIVECLRELRRKIATELSPLQTAEIIR